MKCVLNNDMYFKPLAFEYPEDMKIVKFKTKDLYVTSILGKGHHYIEISLEEVVLFIRPDKILPLARGGNCVGEVDFENLELLGYVNLELLGYVKNTASYIYYNDDGYTKEYVSSNEIPLELTI